MSNIEQNHGNGNGNGNHLVRESMSIQHAMQIYCEPYFVAIQRWCQDKAILKNRISLLGSINYIFHQETISNEAKEYRLAVDYPTVPLEPEVVPTAGYRYVTGGDDTAFKAANQIINNASLFQIAGLHFQNNLLKCLMGIKQDHLDSVNLATWASAVSLVKTAFRLPNSAGNAYIVYRKADTQFGSILNMKNTDVFGMFSMLPLQEDLLKLYLDLEPHIHIKEGAASGNNASGAARKRERNEKNKTPTPATTSVHKPSSSTSSSNSKKKRQKKEEKKVDDQIEWTTDHEKVGTKVALQFFDKRGVGSFFQGAVTKYAPPTDEDEALYHIVWDDGDEQDMDDKDLMIAIKNYDKYYGNNNKDN